MEAACTYYAALAPATCHEGSVRGHTTACSENAFCCAHPFNILGVGLLADKNNLLAPAVPCHCILCREDYLAYCSTRTGGQTLDQRGNLLLSIRVTNRVEEFIKLSRINPHHSSFLINETFLKHIHCHVQGSGTGTLAGTALKHIEGAFLDGKLNIKHVTE